jgi:hypothetical protein
VYIYPHTYNITKKERWDECPIDRNRNIYTDKIEFENAQRKKGWEAKPCGGIREYISSSNLSLNSGKTFA